MGLSVVVACLDVLMGLSVVINYHYGLLDIDQQILHVLYRFVGRFVGRFIGRFIGCLVCLFVSLILLTVSLVVSLFCWLFFLLCFIASLEGKPQGHKRRESR